MYAPYQENDQTAQKRACRARPLPQSVFVWRAEEQTYVGLQGPRRRPVGRETKERAEGRSVTMTLSRCAGAHCQAGPLAAQCTRTPKNGRTIKRQEADQHHGLVLPPLRDGRAGAGRRPLPHDWAGYLMMPRALVLASLELQAPSWLVVEAEEDAEGVGWSPT